MESFFFNLLNPDKSIRELSEQQLEDLKTQNPFQYCESLLKLTQSSPDESLKLLSTVLMRQFLPKVWPKLDPSLKSIIKNSLLSTLQSCQSWNIAKNVSFVVSELAVFIIQSETGEKWQNFLAFLIKGIHSEDLYLKFGSFIILAEILPFFSETFVRLKEKLMPIFVKNLDESVPEIRKVVIQAFTVFVSVVNTAETLCYADMLKHLLGAVKFMCLTFDENGENCVSCLIELAETEPLYFKTNLKSCFEFFDEVFRKVASLGLRVNLIEFMVILIEKHSSSFFDKNYALSGTCQLITEALSECYPSQSASKSYKKPLISFLQRIISSIGESIIDYILKLSESILSNPSQSQFFYPALILLSELIEFIYNTEIIILILNTIHTFILSETYYVRVACLRIIKKILKVPDSAFKGKIYLNILPIIIRGLNDCDEYVVRKALKACKKFVQLSDVEVVVKYAQDLLPLVLVCADKSRCRTSLVQTIAAFAYVCKSSIRNFFQEIFSVVTNLIGLSSVDDKCKALECLLSLRKITTRPEFLQLVPEYIQILNTLENQNNDLLTAACLKCLITLSKFLKSNFTLYLPYTIPGILFNISSHSIAECENYLEALLAIIDSTKGGYLQYVEKSSELIIFLMKNEISDNTKILTCQIAHSLITVIRESGNLDFFSIISLYAKGFLTEIWTLCEKESEFEVLIEMLKCANGVINATGYNFLTDNEVESIVNGIWKILMEVKSANIEKEIRILNVIDANFNASSYLDIVEKVYMNSVKVLEGQSNEDDCIFAFCVINGIVECVGNRMKFEYVESILKTYVYYLNSDSHGLKKYCYAGLTSLSIKISKDFFIKIAKGLLTALESSLNLVKDSKSVKDRKNKDLALIAIGKVIRARFDCLAGEMIINWWASFLPILSQKSQAQEMHDFLADLVLNFLPSFVNNEKIIRIFVEISFTDACGSMTLPKIKKILELFLEENSSEALYGSIPNKHRHKIQKLQNIN